VNFKAKKVKLQPHETAFIDLPDPRAILENFLRSYICLTEGETISINFTGKQYQLDIKQVEPDTEYHAVDINDADVEIDFDKPLVKSLSVNCRTMTTHLRF
jgi:ubiquitin fusion degradation protein 1